MSYRFEGEELSQVRAQLKELLQTAFPFVNVELAEHWTAGRKGSPRELSIEGARWSDLMIGIFVDQAGYKDTAGLHATESELIAALDESWDKVIFFAQKNLVDTLQAQPKGYADLIQQVMNYKEGKNVAVFKTKGELLQKVLDAVAAHAASALRRYPSRTSGKSDERLAWELMTFTERHGEIHTALRHVAERVKDIGDIESMSFDATKDMHAVYRLTVRSGKRKAMPVIVSVCPDRFSFAEAARFVGYPFRTLTDGWKGDIGPLHIVCIYRSITDAQIRRHLGNPDIRVVKERWGYFARDPERFIQSLYLTNCDDETSLRERLRESLDWIASELKEVLASAEARGRILTATVANTPDPVPSAGRRASRASV
jgi:hypothetical protein